MNATPRGTLSGLAVFAALTLAAACAKQRCPTTTPQPGGEVDVGPGQLDPELAKLAFEAQGVFKIKLKVDENGKVSKLALYHNDVSKVTETLVKAVEERYPGATILFYENEYYLDGGRVHEVEFSTAEGVKCELSRTTDGQERYVECHLAADALPEAVAAAVSGAVAGGEVVEAERKEWADGRVRYHVEVRASEQLYYLVLDEEGKIVERYLRVPAFVDLAVIADQ